MSSYAKLPEPEETPANDPPRGRERVEAALARAGKVAGSLGNGLRDAGAGVAGSIGTGLREASAALRGPEGAEIEGLLSQTDLPDLSGDDPLRALAARLDREADLWRNLAFRELAQERWTNRIVQTVAVTVAAGAFVAAALAVLGAMVGAHGRVPLLLTSVGLLIAGGLGTVAVAHTVRRSHREVLRNALARADLAELRLHRVAVALAARALDPGRAVEALERDTRA